MTYLLLTWLLAPLALLRLALSRRSATPQNILLIQTAKIGDYICTTPVIEALRAALPGARLSLLINPLTEPLARHQPGIDRVVTLPGGRIQGFSGRWFLYRLIRRERFDTTICISPNQAFLLIPFLAGVQRRASILPNFNGRSYRQAANFLTATETHRQGRMMVETAMALLQQMKIDIPMPKKRIEPPPGPAEWVLTTFPMLSSGVWIGLGVSSGNKLKELGKEKLSELIDQFLALAPDIGIVLIGSSADRPLAEELCSGRASTENALRVLDTTGRVALDHLAALIDRLDVYVGVDSGITYLADARDVPVVDIMGPADPDDQRPTGKYATILRSDLPCAPCSHAFLTPYHCAIGTRACIMSVVSQHVTQATRKALLNETCRL